MARRNMPEENAAKVEQAPAVEETTETESAPVEENTSEEVQPSEKTNEVENTEPVEKMVPLSALQKERGRRKEAEQYSRQFTQEEVQPAVEPQLPPELPEQENVQRSEPSNPNYMTRDEYDFKESERQRWSEVETEFPQLKDNPELRKLAESTRETSLIKEGKYMTPSESAKAIVDLFGKAKFDGQKAAQESVEIQKRGQLEGSGSKVDNKSQNEKELMDTIKKTTDPNVQNNALHNLLKEED